MEKYLLDWLKVIDGIKNDNTYKAAWGKAIIECISKKEFEKRKGYYIIEEYFIVQKLLKYYWNMNVFFNVHQDDYLVVEKIISEISASYNKRRKVTRVWYKKAELFLKTKPILFEKYIHKMITTVNKNVAFRFMNFGRKSFDLYELDLTNLQLKFTKEQIQTIKKNKTLLTDLINYRWLMFLDKFNDEPHLPRIISLISEDNIHSKKLEEDTKFIDFSNKTID